jgi:hypothetical protein
VWTLGAHPALAHDEDRRIEQSASGPALRARSLVARRPARTSAQRGATVWCRAICESPPWTVETCCTVGVCEVMPTDIRDPARRGRRRHGSAPAKRVGRQTRGFDSRPLRSTLPCAGLALASQLGCNPGAHRAVGVRLPPRASWRSQSGMVPTPVLKTGQAHHLGVRLLRPPLPYKGQGPHAISAVNRPSRNPCPLPTSQFGSERGVAQEQLGVPRGIVRQRAHDALADVCGLGCRVRALCWRRRGGGTAERHGSKRMPRTPAAHSSSGSQDLTTRTRARRRWMAADAGPLSGVAITRA